MVVAAAEGPIRADAVPERADAAAAAREDEVVREYKSDVRKLEELFKKLNPSAEEFVPLSRRQQGGGARRLSADAPVFVSPAIDYYAPHHPFEHQQMHVLQVVGGAGRDSSSDGSASGQPNRRVVDCRICGDPNSVMRFAFIEFADDAGARAALTLGGTILGFYPVRVLPSKTAILPVNPKFLPRTEDEKEMVSRTVYCTNIDKNVPEDVVKNFFEGICGEVARLRLLGDYVHATCIAFVEFVQAEGAILALNCSGMLLGSLPVRVSPSKTPVRPRSPCAMSH
ncbi:hypothetical protein CFC21_111708 [Triticum aestivum]|uniref:RRM domain-containing protein n=2 Tax=Triticum aestivum TaxID=4565 RepID=A0A9R1NFC8_WHEAT|nr:hypothetical protein CFC21_111708 [Triticum aestivum]